MSFQTRSFVIHSKTNFDHLNKANRLPLGPHKPQQRLFNLQHHTSCQHKGPPQQAALSTTSLQSPPSKSPPPHSLPTSSSGSAASPTHTTASIMSTNSPHHSLPHGPSHKQTSAAPAAVSASHPSLKTAMRSPVSYPTSRAMESKRW